MQNSNELCITSLSGAKPTKMTASSAARSCHINTSGNTTQWLRVSKKSIMASLISVITPILFLHLDLRLPYSMMSLGFSLLLVASHRLEQTWTQASSLDDWTTQKRGLQAARPGKAKHQGFGFQWLFHRILVLQGMRSSLLLMFSMKSLLEMLTQCSFFSSRAEKHEKAMADFCEVFNLVEKACTYSLSTQFQALSFPYRTQDTKQKHSPKHPSEFTPENG